jgi:nitrous oxide reductase accessory protein NosL
VTLSGLDGSLTSTFAGGSIAPWSSLSASYQKILQGGAFIWGRGAATVTLHNLVAGHQYQVQMWVNDSRAGGTAVRTETVTGANTVILAYNSTQVDNGVGQYTIGAFTATTTTQSFTIDGGNSTAQINAIQVRDVTSMISWSTPTTISNPTDISTIGTLLYAYNGSDSDTTVNGVTFTGENGTTNWGVGVTLLGWSEWTPSDFEGGKSQWSTSNSPWDNLPAGYKTMLQGGTYSWSGVSTVKLNNLVVGHQYQVQVWAHTCDNSVATELVSGANTVALAVNSLQALDGLGQFVIGTFTANATTQSFTMDGNTGNRQINAIQVRDISGNVTWEAPKTISGAADVSTNGMLLYAYNNSGISATVHGVSFTGVNSATTWGTDVTLSTMNGSTASAYMGVAYPWSSLPTSYQTILQGGAYNNGGVATVTMNNLVFGHQYQVQFWVNDSRASTRAETLMSANGNSITLLHNSNETASGVGQYAIGNFTAISTTQSFTINSDSSSQINAIQVRDISGHVTWSEPNTISSEADISTRGTLLYAYNNSGNTATVNGVTFTGVDSATAWGTGVTLFGLNGSLTSVFAGGSIAPWNALPTAYQTILQGGAFIWGSGSATVMLNDLVAGHQYQVQIWVNDSRGSTRSQTVASTMGNTVSLAYDSTQAAGGVGQYAIGTFTAEAKALSFTINGGIDTAQINAIQIRDITPSSYGSWTSNRVPSLTPGYNDGPAADPDGDGISNLMEFALGGEPMISSQLELPVLSKSADGLLFQYDRNKFSITPATTQVVEYGNDLIGWTPVTIDTDTSGVVSIQRENTYDRVSVAIPTSGSKIFVRLKVNK